MTYQDALQKFEAALGRLIHSERHTDPADIQDARQQLQEAARDLTRLQVLVIPEYFADHNQLSLSSIRAIWPDETLSLPVDTEVIGWDRDWLCSSLQVKVWSTHFPPVPEFTAPPKIPLPLAAAAKPGPLSAEADAWLEQMENATLLFPKYSDEAAVPRTDNPAPAAPSDVVLLEKIFSRNRPHPNPTHTAPEARASPPATTPASLAPTHSRDDQED